MYILPRNQARRVWCGLLLTFAWSSPGLAGQTTGMAFDLQSDELLYSETHCLNADGSEREVTYRDTEGELLARKLVDYSSGSTTPSFVQYNHYSQESIEVVLQQGGIKMTVTDTESQTESKSTVAQPKGTLPVVIDAGFDDFVRQNWEGLLVGEGVNFQFPFADRSSVVELRIQPRACSYPTQTDQCFRLDLANWFLRLLVNPIELGYDIDSQRLTRYIGLSNIGDGNGNGVEVDIRYQYREFNPQACQHIDQTLTDGSAKKSAEANRS